MDSSLTNTNINTNKLGAIGWAQMAFYIPSALVDAVKYSISTREREQL